MRLNDGTAEIKSSAFSGCEKLSNIYIPASVTAIDSYVFSWNTTLVIRGAAGSYAETYAKNKNITFQETELNDVTYRFKAGKTIKITAVPDAGWHFVGWSCEAGGVTSADKSSATTTFVMPSADVTVTATFAADE